MSDPPIAALPAEPAPGLIRLTHLNYALHAFTVLTGLMTTAFIVTAFVTGWPSLIAVVLNYLKRSEVRGTWLESHYRWQLRTFWFALLWLLIGLSMALTLVGIPMAIALFALVGLWVLYRVARGWLRLNDRRPMPL
ncbi:MAG: DUF4870 family protein [Thiobacillaceae bacterium]